MFECIKGFSIEKCDDNGFALENEYISIEEGSTWSIPEDTDYRFIGGEVRLEDEEGTWIEISEETLKLYFTLQENHEGSESDESLRIFKNYIA